MSMKISVVIPSFNQGKFIGRTIESALAQSVPDMEIAVMDGGSSDETVEVLKSYGDRLRFVSEPDKGQADAVNKGIAATNGEIIAWINSDDVHYPGAYAAVREFFEKRPDVDVVYGEADHIDEADCFIEEYPSEPFSFERLKDVCFICQPAAFFRRRAVSKWGALDAGLQFSLDYEFWLRLAKSGATFAFLPQKLAGSRFYPDTKTLGSRLKVHVDINDMMRRTFGLVPDRWIFNYAHVYVDERWGVRQGGPLFTPAVCLASLRASLRWNRGIPASVWRRTLSWLTRGLVREASGPK